jgi:hypothetical protein
MPNGRGGSFGASRHSPFGFAVLPTVRLLRDPGGGEGRAGQRVADGQAGVGVEEVQAAGVDGQLEGLSGADGGAG